MDISFTEEMQFFLDTYHEAAGGRDAKAMCRLANIYVNTSSAELHKDAFELYRKAAKLGCTDAMFCVGVCYELGKGVKKNSREAISWYSAAERHITNDLMNNPDPVGEKERELVRTYLDNEELINSFFDLLDSQKDAPNVLENDKCLAESGDAEAQFRMGCRYLDGNGVKKNEQTAYEWFEKSAEQDCEKAVFKMMEYYNFRKEYDMAVKWYRRYAIIRIRWRNKRLGW